MSDLMKAPGIPEQGDGDIVQHLMNQGDLVPTEVRISFTPKPGTQGDIPDKRFHFPTVPAANEFIKLIDGTGEGAIGSPRQAMAKRARHLRVPIVILQQYNVHITLKAGARNVPPKRAVPPTRAPIDLDFEPGDEIGSGDGAASGAAVLDRSAGPDDGSGTSPGAAFPDPAPAVREDGGEAEDDQEYEDDAVGGEDEADAELFDEEEED